MLNKYLIKVNEILNKQLRFTIQNEKKNEI